MARDKSQVQVLQLGATVTMLYANTRKEVNQENKWKILHLRDRSSIMTWGVGKLTAGIHLGILKKSDIPYRNTPKNYDPTL